MRFFFYGTLIAGNDNPVAARAHGLLRDLGPATARGGIRTPWVDVPTIRLSGKGDPSSFIGMLGGSGEPMTKTELDKLYPGGKAEYLRRFTTSLDEAIRRGHIVREDREEILAIAAINYDTAP